MARRALRHLSGTSYVIPAPAATGLFEQDGRVVLIDSGNDDEAGRQILAIITEHGWQLDRIINTHSNADHIGGNAFLREKTGCLIATSGIEKVFTEFPQLESAFLNGGFPPKSLRSKFLHARPSEVGQIVEPDSQIPGTPLRSVALPGHFFGMFGILTPDRVLYAADSLFSRALLDKYPVFFVYDVAAHLRTLDLIEHFDADWVVPSHAEPTQDPVPLVQANRARLLDLVSIVLEACGTPASFEDVLRLVCARFGLTLDMSQYVLAGSTVRSVLSYLEDSSMLVCLPEAGAVRWSAQT